MLDYPTTIRKSLIQAKELAVEEFGLADIAIIGGDNISDYPDWDKSCALPKKNFLDIKEKINLCVSSSVKDGKVELKATNQPMSTAITYPVKMIFTLDNHSEVTTTVKVKPINKTPNLTQSLNRATLYKTSSETVSFKVISKSSDTNIADIKCVEDKNSKYFNFAYDNETGKVSISLKDTAKKLKPGNYVISYYVTMDGAAYNVNPTVMRFTITVK